MRNALRRTLSHPSLRFALIEIIVSMGLVYYLLPLILLKLERLNSSESQDSLYIYAVSWIAISVVAVFLGIITLIFFHQKIAKFKFHWINGFIGGLIGLLPAAILLFLGVMDFPPLVKGLIFFVPMVFGINFGLQTTS